MPEESAETKAEARVGIVGFFDILGFKNYIENDPDVGSKHALEIILKIKTEVPKHVKKHITGKILDEVTWNVLSDTIVLSIAYPEKEAGKGDEEQATRWRALIYGIQIFLDIMSLNK